VPQDQFSDDDRKRLDQLADLAEITILHIIYQQKAYEGHAKDYEFSGTSRHSQVKVDRRFSAPTQSSNGRRMVS
jgi:hypothetical protein